MKAGREEGKRERERKSKGKSKAKKAGQYKAKMIVR